ncbi:MAG: Adenosylhomocysteinase, partial [uncultured Gemmatimonadaceae bacterium]
GHRSQDRAPREQRRQHRPSAVQGARPLARRVRAQRDPPRRVRDAGPHGDPQGVRGAAAPQGRAHHGVAAHDRADGRAHRDARRPRRRRALGVVQHLQHAGPRRRRGGGGQARHGREAAGRRRVRVEGGDARGVLVVHRAGADVARRRRPQHAARRRRRRHAAHPQGRGVREERRGAAVRRRARARGVGGDPRHAAHHDRGRRAALDARGRRDQGRLRGDHHGRAPAVRDDERRHPALPGDQRQRLGDQEQVRQPLRLPALAHRRHPARERRDARRQGGRGDGLRRRGQGVRAGAARPGRARGDHRDRPDLRAAGGDGGVPGHHPRGRGGDGGHLHHRHRQQGHHHGRPHAPHEGQGDRGQHRPLRQRDRHGRPEEARRAAREHQAAVRRVRLPRRPLGDDPRRGAAAQPRLRHRPPELRDERVVHQPGDGADRALRQRGQVRAQGVRAPQAPRREGRAAAPRQAGREAHPAHPRPGRLHRRPGGRAVQAGDVPLL